MPVFSYRARDKRGKIAEGAVDAFSVDAVANLLTDKGYIIVDIKKEDMKKSKEFSLDFLKRVSNKDLVIFFRQLAVMVSANLPIVSALRILIRQTEDKYLKVVVAGIADEVDGGTKLSVAMSAYGKVFSPFFTSVIASGETSGRLAEVMDYLADQQEKDYDLRARVRGAMIYPALIISGLVIVGYIVMTFVIPKTTEMLIDSGADLPMITKILIVFSDFFKNNALLVALLIVGSVVGSWYAVKRTKDGRRLFDWIKIKMPVFGEIFTMIYMVRITRSFATLLKGGVPIDESLESVSNVVGNQIYKDILTQAIKDVDEGNALSESLAEYDEIPLMVSQIINVGEESGRLEETLNRLTDFYTREINNKINNLSTLIEPLIMIFMGIAVGAFVAAVIMPMWQLSAVY